LNPLQLVLPPAPDHAPEPIESPVLSFQPEPEVWQVVQTPDGLWTAVFRGWNPGDARRCRLCPVGSCVADDNYCLIQVSGRVSTDEARLFNSNGMKRVKRG
jgi:hypothetical protein